MTKKARKQSSKRKRSTLESGRTAFRVLQNPIIIPQSSWSGFQGMSPFMRTSSTQSSQNPQMAVSTNNRPPQIISPKPSNVSRAPFIFPPSTQQAPVAPLSVYKWSSPNALGAPSTPSSSSMNLSFTDQDAADDFATRLKRSLANATQQPYSRLFGKTLPRPKTVSRLRGGAGGGAPSISQINYADAVDPDADDLLFSNVTWIDEDEI